MACIFFYHLLRSKNYFGYTYSILASINILTKRDNYSTRGFSSRIPKSWFKLKKKTYDIVGLHEVSQRKTVPDYIKKPDYALSGVADEQTTIEILNENKLECMRQSCALAKIVLEDVGKHVVAGISTDELDTIAHNLCIHYGAYPSPLNYRGYPKSICTSVNNVACHGIPDKRKLINGDIISIDISNHMCLYAVPSTLGVSFLLLIRIGDVTRATTYLVEVFYNGYHGDCAATFQVGEVDKNAQKLIEVASECLIAAIEICQPNLSFHQIGKTISSLARQQGFSVIPAFCGHGIGSSFHTPPNILHYDNDEEGEMKKGMIFTIEPVICEGRPDIVILEDGWTAVTEDDSRSAQFEHTLLITENGPEILTVADAFKK